MELREKVAEWLFESVKESARSSGTWFVAYSWNDEDLNQKIRSSYLVQADQINALYVEELRRRAVDLEFEVINGDGSREYKRGLNNQAKLLRSIADEWEGK